MHTTGIYRIPIAISLALATLTTVADAQSIKWRSMGRQEGGTITRLDAIGEHDILAQTTMGIYRSTNSGRSWRQFGDDELRFARFVGGGDGHPLFVHHHLKGTLRSTDNGSTWSHVDGLTGVPSIHVDAQGRFFAGIDGRIYHSADNGGTWYSLHDAGVPGTSSCFADGPDGSMYVAFLGHPTTATTTSSGEGTGTILRTTDGGISWSVVPTGGLPGEIAGFVAYPDGTLFAGVNGHGVYTSTDAGATWTLVIGCTLVRDMRLVESKLVLVAEKEVFFFASDGVWDHLTCFYGANLLTAIGNPRGGLLIGSVDFGVFDCDPMGHVSFLNNGLDAFGGKRIEARFDGLVTSVSGDRGFTSQDLGASWQPIEPAKARAVVSAITPQGTRLYWSQFGNWTEKFMIERSIDQGNTWAYVRYGEDVRTVVAGSRNDAYAILLPIWHPTYGITRSGDDGATWTPFIELDPATDGEPVSLMADGDRLLIGTRSGDIIEYAIPSGNRLSRHQAVSGSVDMIRKLPNGTLFAMSRLGGLRRSLDGGASWIVAQPTLGMENALYADLLSDERGRIFLGTDRGVFLSVDNGASWTRANTGLTWTQDGQGLPPVDPFTNERPVYTLARGNGDTIYAGSSLGVYVGVVSAPAVSGVSQPSAPVVGLTAATIAPTPASGIATLRIDLERDARVTLRVMDMTGRDVLPSTTLRLGAGAHALPIDGSSLAPGLYDCGVMLDGQVRMVPLVIVR